MDHSLSPEQKTTSVFGAVSVFFGIVAFIALAILILGDEHDTTEVIQFSDILIQEVTTDEEGVVTVVVPTIEGIEGPAILAVLGICSAEGEEEEGCFTVPLSFEINNLTDGQVIAEVLGQWHNTEFGRTCASSETPLQLVSEPGLTMVQFPTQPPPCVVVDLEEIRNEFDVAETVWSISGVIEPVGEGVVSMVVSQNFTLVLDE